MQLIAQMRDDEGSILIPGFADAVRPLTAAEFEAVHNLPPVEEQLKREFGLGRTEGDEPLPSSVMAAREVGLAPAAMSRHLRTLRQSGLVEESHPVFDARVRVYALRAGAMDELKAWLEETERLEYIDPLTGELLGGEEAQEKQYFLFPAVHYVT